MVQQSLKSNKLIDMADDIFINLRASRQGDDEPLDALLSSIKDGIKGERKETVITYKRWVDVPVVQIVNVNGIKPREGNKTAPERRTQYVKANKVKDLLQTALNDFQELKEHLKRNSDIKKYIKDKKEEVLDFADKAMLHFDWSECGMFHQPGN